MRTAFALAESALNRFRSLVASVVFLTAVASCSRDSAPRPPSDIATQDSAAAACPQPDTNEVAETWTVTFNAVTRATLDSIDRRLTAAAPVDVPALLFARGRARMAFEPHAQTPDARYASGRPDVYGYNEVGGNWLYNGVDFQDLIKRFPDHALADEAAYALTRLSGGGECEGVVPCYIGREWAPVAEFLRARPHSPRADLAVTRAIAAFRHADDVEDLRVATDMNDVEGVRGLVAELDTLGRTLPQPLSARLLIRAGELWERYLEYDRAKSAYAAALTGADTALTACIHAHVAAIPAKWFVQDAARGIGPRLVELQWQSPGPGATSFTVYRSTTSRPPGIPVAHLGADARRWSDTAAPTGIMLWYRVDAEFPGGVLPSNPVYARTPGLDMFVRAVAVSVTDKRLHIFGALSNGFPQVIIVSSDGKTIDRSDGILIGADEWRDASRPVTMYVDDVWLADANGLGVLRFHKTGAEYPAELTAAVRQGGELLRDSVPRDNHLLASLDEPRRVAWLAPADEGGLPNPGRREVVSMSCVSAQAVCWISFQNEVVLRTEAGATLFAVQIPHRADGRSDAGGASVFANPQDSSAWIFARRQARLLHVDRTGAVRSDIALADTAAAWSVGMTADPERQVLWVKRLGPVKSGPCADPLECRMEFVQIEMNTPNPAPRIVTTNIPAMARLVPDLTGGVWMVSYEDIRRIDASGKTLFKIPMPGR